LDLARRAKQFGVSLPIFPDSDEATEIADSAPLADAYLIKRAHDRILLNCISSLDQSDAMFIKYACIGGSTYADLAKNEGQPLVTVKSRKRRALLKLRGGMEGAV